MKFILIKSHERKEIMLSRAPRSSGSMRLVPAGTGLVGAAGGAESRVLRHARADVGARSLAGLGGLGVGWTERPARLRTRPAGRARRATYNAVLVSAMLYWNQS